ncbi:MAG: hypothetical protein IT385_15020 [Deltaproteobacteria bacterium]|nr:hypothetical protein [Deltaproteobacteria bacterium]
MIAARVTRLLPCLLLPLAACPDDGLREASDADVVSDGEIIADVPEPTGVERLDWTDVRGEPIDAVTVEVSERALRAAHADGVVTVAGCEEGAGCDYVWLDAVGDVVKSLEDRSTLYSGIIPPQADRIALVRAERTEDCGPAPPYPTVVTGRYELVDVPTGETSWSAELRSNVFADPAFLPSGRWFRVDAIPGQACETPVTVWRERAPPHAPSVWDDWRFYPADELPDGRWVGWRGEAFGVVDPDDADGFVALGDRVDGWAAGGGWVHGFDGYGDLTEVDRALDDAGQRVDLTLPEDHAWRGRWAWGRWLVACRHTDETGVALCALFDVRGEHAARELRVDTLVDQAVTFIGPGAALLVRTRDGASQRVERVPLPGGEAVVVARGEGALHPLGAAEAALWEARDVVRLIEADRLTTLVEGPVDQVVTLVGAPRGAAPAIGPGGPRQRALATIVETEAVGVHRLHLFDLTTRRLVTLSERLDFGPFRAAPLLVDSCTQPWTLRSAGWAGDGYRQDARWFFFVERAPEGAVEAPLWIVPIDLSSPPRRLGAMHPIYCHPPMASPDGSLVVLDVDHWDGLSSQLTIARP